MKQSLESRLCILTGSKTYFKNKELGINCWYSMQDTIKEIFTESIQVQIAAGEVLPSALE